MDDYLGKLTFDLFYEKNVGSMSCSFRSCFIDFPFFMSARPYCNSKCVWLISFGMTRIHWAQCVCQSQSHTEPNVFLPLWDISVKHPWSCYRVELTFKKWKSIRLDLCVFASHYLWIRHGLVVTMPGVEVWMRRFESLLYPHKREVSDVATMPGLKVWIRRFESPLDHHK